MLKTTGSSVASTLELMTMRLLVVVVLELKVVEVYANGFIRPSKSPAGTPRQAGKDLILPEDFLLADAIMVFHLQ